MDCGGGPWMHSTQSCALLPGGMPPGKLGTLRLNLMQNTFSNVYLLWLCTRINNIEYQASEILGGGCAPPCPSPALVYLYASSESDIDCPHLLQVIDLEMKLGEVSREIQEGGGEYLCIGWLPNHTPHTSPILIP